jgi:hypothetical protein
MTKEEVTADVLVALVDAIAFDILSGSNSGVEDVYKNYVRQIAVDEGSY